MGTALVSVNKTDGEQELGKSKTRNVVNQSSPIVLQGKLFCLGSNHWRNKDKGLRTGCRSVSNVTPSG